MEKQFGNVNPKINEYVLNVCQPEDDILKEVRERMHQSGLPMIQVSPMDARHLEVITRAVRAKNAVEIGTLGGYSGIAILRGLQKGGKLYTFEIDPHHAKIARDSFAKAGFQEFVEIALGPALKNLPAIEKDGPFDMVFLDADKAGYLSYFKWAAKNLRLGGVLLADNAFAWGKIANKNLGYDPDSTDIQALQRFDAQVCKDQRFLTTILPTGEGLLFSVKMR